jgi:hypothetical protein
VKFRETEKVSLQVLVPVEIDDRLRALRGRRMLNQVVSAACCQYLGMDPASFGLEDDIPATKPAKKPRRVAVPN